MQRAKILKAMALLLLASTLMTIPVYGEDIEEVEEIIAQNESDLDDTISAITTLEDEIDSKKEELSIQKTQLENLNMYQEEQKNNMKLRIQYMYENNNTSLIPLLLSSSSFPDFLNKIVLTLQVHEYDRKVLQNFSDTMESVKKIERQIQNSIDELNSKKMALNAKREKIEEELQDNKELLEKLQEEERRREEERERERRREEEERKKNFNIDTSSIPKIDSSNGKTLMGTWYITGYTSVAEENGGYAGIDCKGRPLIPWYTVACTALPLGTKVEIEGVGQFEVRDTGVRGNHIDVCVNNQAEAYSITGYRKVWVIN